MIKVLPPKTAEDVVARERERKIGGNDESKKMHKYLLKQQFKGFSVSTSEGLHKGYDRFQTLLSQLETHGAGVSHEDANQKFLMSLPSSWSQVALIMRTKPGLDTISFDDLYNNLRVFECDVKGTTASSSNTHNVAFVSADNTSSIMMSVPLIVFLLLLSQNHKRKDLHHTLMKSVTLSLQINQVTMISMRIKKFHNRTGRKLQSDTKDPVGFDKTKVECFNCHKMGHFARDYRAKGNQDKRRRDVVYNGNKARDNGKRPTYQDDSKALVTINGEDIDWSGHVEEDAQNYAMMAYSSSNLGSANESVFMNKASDLEDTSINDRYADRMHAVPPPMIGNYMPSGPDVEIDYSKFTYGLKQTSVDELDSKSSEYVSCGSDFSVETTTSILEPEEYAPKIVCEPKMWTDAPIIEEYESDSDNDSVFNVQEDKEKPSFAFTDSVKPVKTSRENVKETGTPNHSPKIEKKNRNGHTRKGLGYAFTRKECFVCGSFSHLIRDCDFHEKRMAKQAELTKSKNKVTDQKENRPDDPHKALKDKGIVDSGYFRHMTGKKAHLVDYQEFNGGSDAFGGSNGRITGKGKIKAGRLDFEDVYYVEELNHYNLFSVSQMCDKKNKVFLTDTDCLVLSPDFKLPDENQVLLKIPRQHNMYSFNLKNIDPSRDLPYLLANTSIDESNKWHRRLGYVNFKNLNKLVKGNLVRGLPSKIFENDHICVAYQKGKQHKASCKAKTVKRIKREYSNARTPQQNGVAERKNKTFIEAAKTMLADSFLPTTFWAETVNTACYVLNRVLVTKPQNKTPYELLTGRQPIISYLRPFGCHVTILNSIDQLGKFNGKSNSGFLVRYSLNSKAFRVYNLETKRVEENLHVNFLENEPNVAGKGHAWMFDLDYLTNSMNYEPVSLENQDNKSTGPKEGNISAGTQANDDQGAHSEEINLHDEHFVLPTWFAYSTTVKSSGDKIDKNEKPVSQVEQIFQEELEKLKRQEKEANDAVSKEATHDTQDANTTSINL
nr:hypothetical protein [Tanacetum cinerariifolium]